MRTTLDLPSSLVNEALKVSHQKTKSGSYHCGPGGLPPQKSPAGAQEIQGQG